MIKQWQEKKKHSPHLGGGGVLFFLANADLVHQHDFFYFPNLDLINLFNCNPHRRGCHR